MQRFSGKWFLSLLIHGLVALLLTLFVTVSPPVISWDAGFGFMVLRSMERGAAWNTFFDPNPADLSADMHTFLVWWSPGQYTLPALLTSLRSGVGGAINCLQIVFSLACLSGFWYLFRTCGCDRKVTAGAVASIALSRHFVGQLVDYSAELLLWGAVPWIILAARRLAYRPVLLIVLLPPLFLLCAFLKLSFVISALALSVALMAWNRTTRGGIRRFTAMCAAASSFAVFYAALEWTFLSRNYHPGIPDIAVPDFSLVESAAIAFIHAAFSGFSLGESVLQLIRSSESAFVPVQLVLTAFAIAAVGGLLLRPAERIYRDLAISFLVVFTVVLALMWEFGAQVSVDERHARPCGMLLAAIPWITLVRGRQWLYRGIASVMIVYSALQGFSAISEQLSRSAPPTVGRSGVEFRRIASADLRSIQCLDDLFGNDDLIVTTEPDLSVELLNTRFQFLSFPARSYWRPYRGKVENLIIILGPEHRNPEDTVAVISLFLDYDPQHWLVRYGETLTVLYQGENRALFSSLDAVCRWNVS